MANVKTLTQNNASNKLVSAPKSTAIVDAKEALKAEKKQVKAENKATKTQLKNADESIKGLRTKILAYNSDTLIEVKANEFHLKVLRLSKKDTTVFQIIDVACQTAKGICKQNRLIDFLSANYKTLLSKNEIALVELKKVVNEKHALQVEKYEIKKAERLAKKEAELAIVNELLTDKELEAVKTKTTESKASAVIEMKKEVSKKA